MMVIGSFSYGNVLMEVNYFNLLATYVFLLVSCVFVIMHFLSQYRNVYFNEFVRKLMLFWFNLYVVVEFSVYLFFYLGLGVEYSMLISSVFVIALVFSEYYISEKVKASNIRYHRQLRNYHDKLSKQSKDSVFYLSENLKKSVFFYGHTKSVDKIKEELALINLILDKIQQWFLLRYSGEKDKKVYDAVDADLKLYISKLLSDPIFIDYAKKDKVVGKFKSYLDALSNLL